MKKNVFVFRCLLGSLLSLLPLGCGGSAAGDDPGFEGIATRAMGWLRGDLHLHTTYSDGDDPPAVLAAIGEFFEDALFLRVHPEYAENGLDFLAMTDHRTVAGHADPGWRSERLILLNGMEWGGPSHANCIGVHTLVPHDPDGDGVTQDDVRRSVAETHSQGGIFSLNHPFHPDMEFSFDVRDHDAVEIWNSGFGLMSPTYTLADLAEREARTGPASVFFKKAAARQDIGGSYQALVFYEALLARGVHVALVGGSDRHTVLPPGFPATWVRAESADAAGVLDAIRARRTFVSRGPAAAQVLLEVKAGSETYEMGREIPIAAGGETAKVRVRVGRAVGARLRLIVGRAVSTDEQLEAAELEKQVLERSVDRADFTAEWELQVQPGDWLYPQVWEPLIASDSSAETAAAVRELAAQVAKASPEDFVGLAQLLVNTIPNTDVLLNASLCSFDDWLPGKAHCLITDDNGLATYFLPDFVDRAFNVIIENGQVGDWCMGAVGSAVRFVSR